MTPVRSAGAALDGGRAGQGEVHTEPVEPDELRRGSVRERERRKASAHGVVVSPFDGADRAGGNSAPPLVL